MLQNDNRTQIQMSLLKIEALYGAGLSLQKCCKMVGISVHTYYKWRQEVSASVAENRKTS